MAGCVSVGSVQHITLNNGVTIPQVGFGVFQVPPQATRETVLTALEVGYRHIDTAQLYGNEAGVGQAIASSGLDRSEVFVTSKLSTGAHAPDAAMAAFDRSLAELGTDYLDLFLIHWPMPKRGDITATWAAMERIYQSGRARAVGVSNFQESHLERVLAMASVVPAVNQIEISPYVVNDPLRAFDATHGIATEAWSPIARGRVTKDPVIQAIAARVGRSPAQVTLRWHVQRGDIVFPKSMHRERMVANLALFDFELSESEMAAITALDCGERTGPHPDEFDWVPER